MKKYSILDTNVNTTCKPNKAYMLNWIYVFGRVCICKDLSYITYFNYNKKK